MAKLKIPIGSYDLAVEPESSEKSLYGDPPKERKILGNLCATTPEQMKKAR